MVLGRQVFRDVTLCGWVNSSLGSYETSYQRLGVRFPEYLNEEIMWLSLFWDVTWHRLVVTDVSGYLICYIFKDQAVLDCPETSVSKYEPTLRNIPEEERLIYTAAKLKVTDKQC